MDLPQPINLRLLYLSCARIPSEKAHAYQILKMCESFARQGMAVTLLYQRRRHKERKTRMENVFTYYAISNTFTLKKLFCVDSALVEKLHSGIWFYVLTISYLCAAVCYLARHRKTIDIIYCRDIFSLLVLAMLRPVIKLPVFYEAHSFPETLTRIHVYCLKNVHGIITLTGQLKSLLMQKGVKPENIAVAHDGVDLSRFAQALCDGAARRAQMAVPAKSILIGYVGRFVTLEQEKGIADLLTAMRYLPEYDGSIYMAFIGGPMHCVATYYQLIDALRLDRDHFRFIDLVPAGDVPSYLAACDIVAMPFPWTAHYAFYMSPLKMFEYMAAGKPILATKLPSVMEVLVDGKNAVLVEPDNPQELAQGIRRIIEDKSLSLHISMQARRDVLNHTWERRAQNIAHFMMDRIPTRVPTPSPITGGH